MPAREAAKEELAMGLSHSLQVVNSLKLQRRHVLAAVVKSSHRIARQAQAEASCMFWPNLQCFGLHLVRCRGSIAHSGSLRRTRQSSVHGHKGLLLRM